MKNYFSIFLFVGLALLGGAAFAYQRHVQFLEKAHTAVGTVIELKYQRSGKSGGTYHPVFTFTAENGKRYTIHSDSGTSPPTYHVNEKVTVLYDPQSPQDAMTSDFFSQWGVSIILGIMGSVFILIYAVPIYLKSRRRQDIEWLKSFGQTVQAEFVGARLNTSIRVMGRSPYQVVCQWLDPKTNKVFEIASDNIWFDPAVYIKSQKLSALVDPNNPKRNYLDISFLPEAG